MNRSFCYALWLLAVALVLPASYCPLPTASAAKVKVWHHYAPSHYEKAQLKQAVVSNEGALRLAHQLKPLTGLDATHVWNVVEDKDGNLVQSFSFPVPITMATDLDSIPIDLKFTKSA